MDDKFLLFFFLSFVLLFFSAKMHLCGSAADTISAGQSLTANQTIVSKGGDFELGFFTPDRSLKHYLGIWYKKAYAQNRTGIWVANGDQPIIDLSSSELKLLENGNLVILNEFKIHGAKLKYYKRSKRALKLISWKNSEDPSPGLFSFELLPSEFVMTWRYSMRTRATGQFGRCSTGEGSSCQCLQGFEELSLEDRNLGDPSGGCARNSPLQCLVLVAIWTWRKWGSVEMSDAVEGSLVAFTNRDLKVTTKNFSEKIGGGAFVGIARGIAYLHEECRDYFIHCDIKPENIRLDADFTPKVADFGLAKLVCREFSRVIMTFRGTIGYMAPEWSSGVAITTKVDVYSYGMMLFEIISGRKNLKRFKDGKAWFFPTWAANKVISEGQPVLEILDNKLQGNVDIDELKRAFRVACWCIQEEVAQRSSMGQVVQILEGLLEANPPPIQSYLQSLVDNEKTENLFSQ
ncbi:hypothetical protein Sjap_003517 [Stephania japonica]|uniref:Protein kinase domain-containing protein n=1 Tax=Stephania japonica TaxID=461633 RepID=A0AAP0PTN5_9MAGN